MRRCFAALRFAWQGLSSRPFETVLMALTFTVIFGASLTAVSLVRSGREELEHNLELFGKDIVHVHRGLKWQNLFGGLAAKLAEEDVDRLAHAVDGVATGAQIALAVVGAGGEEFTTVLVGTDTKWPDVNGSTFAAGSFFANGREDTCVLDSWVARRLFGAADAMGKTMRVSWAGRTQEFTVAGVMADPLSIRERFQGFDVLKDARPLLLRILEGRNLYIPRSCFRSGMEIALCLARHGPDLTPTEARDRILDALGERAGTMTVWARGHWLDTLLDMLDIAYVFSNAVWALFLLLTGAMVMTIGLLAVTERTVELGIRRTQGATRRGICGQILLEGTILGGVGALAGFSATPLAGAWLCRNLPWQLRLRAEDMLLVFGAGMAVAVLSFLVPALRAARLEPVEVLREL